MMTREEAIAYFKRHIDLYCVDGISREAEEMAIKALEQEPVLDRIRDEIEEMDFDFGDYDHTNRIIEMVLEVIDKYKAESEEV